MVEKEGGAVRELFELIGRRCLLDVSMREGLAAGDLYARVAEFYRRGEMEEGNVVKDQADVVADGALELRRNFETLMGNYLETVIVGLAGLGVKEIPSLDCLLQRRQLETDGDAAGKELLGVSGSPDGDGLVEKRKRDPVALTDSQLQVGAVRLRLVGAEEGVVTTRQAAAQVFRDEIATKVNGGVSVDVAVTGYTEMVSVRWPEVRRKLARGFELLGGLGACLPFTVEQLNKLNYCPETRRFYEKLGAVPAYEGMTLEGLDAYTGCRNVRLTKMIQEAGLPASVTVSAKVPVDGLTVTESEAFFGAEAIVNNWGGNGVSLQTKKFLSGCLGGLTSRVPEDKSLIASLWTKYQAYKRMSEEEREALKKREGGMVAAVLGVFEQKDDQEILAALRIRVAKGGKVEMA